MAVGALGLEHIGYIVAGHTVRTVAAIVLGVKVLRLETKRGEEAAAQLHVAAPPIHWRRLRDLEPLARACCRCASSVSMERKTIVVRIVP